jgi:hypothetical protein
LFLLIFNPISNRIDPEDCTAQSDLLNQPGMPIRTVALDKPYRTAAGDTVLTVTLGTAAGAILLNP